MHCPVAYLCLPRCRSSHPNRHHPASQVFSASPSANLVFCERHHRYGDCGFLGALPVGCASGAWEAFGGVWLRLWACRVSWLSFVGLIILCFFFFVIFFISFFFTHFVVHSVCCPEVAVFTKYLYAVPSSGRTVDLGDVNTVSYFGHSALL